MPQNTLLKPNNVIPSWECGDEENKEVSGTLRRIRMKYDNIHKEVLTKQAMLEQKKKELEMIKIEETNVHDTNIRMTTGLNDTEETLKTIEKRHNAALLDQRTYNHIIHRMKADLIAAKIKQNEMQESFKSKKQIYEEESEKNRTAKQQRLKA